MAITGKFNGTHISSITQNRVVLPKQFKDVLNSYQSDKIVVTLSPYGGLLLYPKVEFDSVCDQLAKGVDKVNRYTLSYLENWSMGIQTLEGSAGRFRISPELLTEAKVKDKIKFIGRGNYIAIWSIEEFEDHQKMIRDQIRQSNEMPVVRL